MPNIRVNVKTVDDGREVVLPGYSSSGAAGMDLSAALREPVTLQAGERALIPTGIRVAIPDGYEGQVRGRSGNAIRRGLGLVNAPGTIDSDYRGEIQVILINWSSEPQTIHSGERIAQLIISPVVRAEISQVDELDETNRGAGGFGHTGL